jgi:hypothetical protein
MKNSPLRILAYLAVTIVVSVQSCTCSRKTFEAIRFDESKNDKTADLRYVEDQIIITYKGTPTEAQRARIREALLAAAIDTTTISIKRCNSCGSYIELWQGDNIHSVIHQEGIRGGTVSGGSKGVGEDSLAHYSLNYIQHLPVERLPSRREIKIGQIAGPVSGAGKDTVVIAVLDTGIDTTQVIPASYTWTNKLEKSSPSGDNDSNCYADDIKGWNFVNSNNDVTDNNINLHGTLVSHFIVSEFRNSTQNYVQLMTLKTHDQNGTGDLFSSICAIHYAIDKGANIINASWGFYYYQDGGQPYLDSLITTGLKQKGILFITASGNKIDAVDAHAKEVYDSIHGLPIPDSLLRNLLYHNFYPACLSDANNNVITVTTTDGNVISPTQNYASRYVDLGVKADQVDPSGMKFLLTFSASPLYISGSSRRR